MKMIYAHYNNIIFCALTRRLFRGAVSMIVIITHCEWVYLFHSSHLDSHSNRMKEGSPPISGNN